MVVICDYSRYPVVEKLNSLSAQTVIPRLEKLFSLFSIPNLVKTDNGPPFHGHDFSDFAKRFGFKHRRITPLHPISNATAEAFMKPLVKTMRTASASGQNYKAELSSFLMNYRSTPHPSTGMSPYQLMFNQKMKTKLPQFSVPLNDDNIRKRDTEAKQKNKRYADNRRNAKTSGLKPGDSVLVKQPIKHKLDTPFNPTPGKVVSRKGSMITVKHNDRLLTRDCSHFKAVDTSADRNISVQHANAPTKAEKPPLLQKARTSVQQRTSDADDPMPLRRSWRKRVQPKRREGVKGNMRYEIRDTRYEI